MSDFTRNQTDFLIQVSVIIEKNIANEQFGVSELADAMNMSRSNLLRKIKKETKLSVSQLIRQARLTRAMELLRTTSYNVSEVSHHVGFGSTSYFIKCFREFYGYPPGEAGKREAEGDVNPVGENDRDLEKATAWRFPSKRYIYLFSIIIIAALAAVSLYFNTSSSTSPSSEKSIAVLPFKNDSNDSSNVYLINGLMEATLNKLQQIKGLKVTSRTSVEQYRHTTKSIREIARELGVRYFVEGSGQKLGDRIVLNIQLIEASTDKHLWSNQYRRDANDIFELQEEIAKNIAKEIQGFISAEDERKLEKKPTDDPVAYDYYLKGRDLFYKSTSESLQQSVPWFKKAIERDTKFALAYASAAMVYYYLDIFQVQKKYSLEITRYADNAIANNPDLPESLIAKGLSYAHKGQYEQAVVWLEKAIQYDPGSGLAVHFLTEFYNIHVSNPGKYLQYALKGVQIDIASGDSATIGFKYFHLANALAQTGFLDEAITYINKSLDYDPNGMFSGYVKAWILFAKTRDKEQTKQLLLQELNKDTTRIDVIQEVGKIHFLMGDYNSAWKYFKKVVDLREMLKLNLFRHEDLNLAVVLHKLGENEKAEAFAKSFKVFADHEKSKYKHMHLAAYYCWKADNEKAMEHLQLFAKEDNYQYWLLLWKEDPTFDEMKRHPELRKILDDIEARFWTTNKKLSRMLADEGLL